MNNFNNYQNQFTFPTAHMMQNMRNNNHLTNFNDGYVQQNNIIEKPNFTNPKNVLHNNLNDNLLTENIVEYYINIDSDDRKIETYPDPFNYVVTFKSLGKTFYKSFNKKRNNDDTEISEIPETPGPVIIRPFKNVKYIKLDHVVLSRYNSNRYTLEQNIMVDTKHDKIIVDNIYLNKHCHKLDKNNSCYLCKSKISCNNFCECKCKKCNAYNKCRKCFAIKDQNFKTEDSNNVCMCETDDKCHSCAEMICKCSINDRNKFLILKVKELKNNRTYSTNTATSDNTFILHVDRSIGNFHNIWITRYGICSFPTSSLFNLERLSIEFCNNKGQKLSIGIIFQCNIKINNEHHKICLIFGKIEDTIKKTINGIKIELPISEISNVKNWYKIMFNKLLPHIQDDQTKLTLNNNFDLLLNSVEHLDIDDLVKWDITNNIFLIVGVYQNELNTLINYEI